MSDRVDHPGVSPALLPEHDEYVDDAVALGRGELSRGEAQRVRERMLRDPVYRGVVEPIVRAYDEPPLSEEDAEIAWPTFVRAAGMPESAIEGAVGSPVDRTRRARRRFLRAAAIVAAAVLLIKAVDAAWYYADRALSFDIVRTSATETVIKQLPDGTVATIGPASELRFPNDMLGDGTVDKTSRHVWPKGEVTFEASRIERTDANGVKSVSMLRIDTPHVWITVWGTRFKVLVLDRVTLVELEEGTLHVRSRMGGPAEFMKAPASARFTATGTYMKKFTKDAP